MTASLKGTDPGPLTHPDIDADLLAMPDDKFAPVVLNAEAGLRIFDTLSAAERELACRLGERLLSYEQSPGQTTLTAQQLLPDCSGIGASAEEAAVAQYLAELGHIFWLEARVIRRAVRAEIAGGKPPHWAHHVIEDLPMTAQLETLIQGFCHARNLATLTPAERVFLWP